MRRVIIHYHIFKNAGTSVDTILRDGFGERWASFDPVDTYPCHVMPADALAEFIVEHPDLVAVSSHIARPPLPQMPGVQFFPIVMVRDPIVRIGSYYKFCSASGATQAEDLSAFLHERFLMGTGSGIGNFQTMHLGGIQARRRWFPFPGLSCPRPTDATFASALAFLRGWPVVGLVEQFAYSVQRFAQWLDPVFPELHWRPLRENVSAPGLGSAREIAHALGPALYGRLVAENQFDFRLYAEAVRWHGDRPEEHEAESTGA